MTGKGAGTEQDTRTRILRTTAELLRRQGYSATGMNQVLQASRAPKGSLYFHFPGGKEHLAAEAVRLAGTELGASFAAAVQDAPSAPAAIKRLGDCFADDLEQSGFSHGCPVATVALEEAGNSATIRAACDVVYSAWLDSLAMLLRAGGVEEDRAESLAGFVLSSLQGALLLARVQRDVAVVRSVAQQVAQVVAQATQH